MGSDKEEESPLDKVSGAVDGLLKSVGLLDIVLGAPPIYFAWVLFRDDISDIFPSTDSPWLDALLLACAASAIGMGMSLLIGICMAIGRIFQSGRRKEVRIIGNALSTKFHLAPIEDDDPIDYGAAFLAQKNAKLFQDVDAARTRARACYGFAISLFILFALNHYKDIPFQIPLLVKIGALVFFLVIGFFHQRDYHATLKIALKQLI